MLVHLLRGEFTVDRDAIDYEAITHDGKTYTYFAVFPAILRLLAMPFVDIAHAELARLSCLMAVVIFVVFQLRTLLIVHYSLPVGSRTRGLFGCSDGAERPTALHLGFGLGLSRADPLGRGHGCRVQPDRHEDRAQRARPSHRQPCVTRRTCRTSHQYPRADWRGARPLHSASDRVGSMVPACTRADGVEMAGERESSREGRLGAGA